jgi:hypothetical protein
MKKEASKAIRLCPSARPEMEGSHVFGVITGPVENRRVGYLTEPQPATDDVLALSRPVAPTEIFRIAAPCAEKACKHFDGIDCRLAQRIVEHLPVASAGLPPCKIRATCRWWHQEGKAACLRCPLVITDNHNASEQQRYVADPDPNQRQ